MTAVLRALTFVVVLILLPKPGYGQAPKRVPDGRGPTPKAGKTPRLVPIPQDEALFNDSDYEIG